MIPVSGAYFRARAAGPVWLAAVILASTTLLPLSAFSQHPLHLVTDRTEVRGIAFNFPETQTFETDRLRAQIATASPSMFDRVADLLPIVSGADYPFEPLELQRDVVRLRQFYNRNGFLHPRIDYPASQLDTTSNTIRVIFTIWEGPPLIVQDFGFRNLEGTYALEAFEDGEERERWIQFRDRLGLRLGSRYTDFERTRVQDEILTWLQDRGYAFAEVDTEVDVDSVANTVDLRFLVDPGPIAYVSDIVIEGNESVSRRVVLRELPLSEGDRFSRSRMVEGQRKLFALNLFRVAVAEVPEQPRDEGVDVHYRVREARPRHVSAQTGYGRNGGFQFQSDWRHRNFLGGARQLTLSLGARTGIWARPVTDLQELRSFTASVSLQQPYLFVNNLSGVVTPFYTWQSSHSQRIEFQEIGLSSSAIYTIHTFRTVRLQHTFSRAYPLGDTEITVDDPTDIDPNQEINRLSIYDRSVITLSGTFGRADQYIEPTRGYLIRPQLETGGLVLASGVQYVKGNLEASRYLPIGRRFDLAARIMGGRIFPFGSSRNQEDPEIEYRFDRIRFYAGGASDVRGWAGARLGPELPRASLVRDADGDLVLGGEEGDATRPIQLTRIGYDPLGGLMKVAGNIEFRMPFPGLGSAWQSAAFVDAGRIYSNLTQMRSRDIPGATIAVEPGRVRVGVGGGIRYRTPVGVIRLDVAMKVNPSESDLQAPADAFRWRYRDDLRSLNPLEPDHGPPRERFWRRFQLHLSLGPAF